MRKRLIQSSVILAATVFLAASVCNGDAPSARQQIAESLRRTVSVDFDQTPLNEVMNYLREVLAVNIVLDDEADETKFITLQLRDVPASSVLHWITRLTDLDYSITDHAIYIAPRRQLALKGRAYFRQYDVTDLLAPLEGALRNNNDNDDDNDDDNDNQNNNRNTNAQRDLMQLILLFTGGQSNWDHFAVMGAGDDENEDDRFSEEDMF